MHISKSLIIHSILLSWKVLFSFFSITLLAIWSPMMLCWVLLVWLQFTIPSFSSLGRSLLHFIINILISWSILRYTSTSPFRHTSFVISFLSYVWLLLILRLLLRFFTWALLMSIFWLYLINKTHHFIIVLLFLYLFILIFSFIFRRYKSKFSSFYFRRNYLALLF